MQEPKQVNREVLLGNNPADQWGQGTNTVLGQNRPVVHPTTRPASQLRRDQGPGDVDARTRDRRLRPAALT